MTTSNSSRYSLKPIVQPNLTNPRTLVNALPHVKKRKNAARYIVGKDRDTPIVMVHQSIRKGISVFNMSPH